MKNDENTRLLDHKRAVDAQRREQAIMRARQQRLRDLTPGTATPASVMRTVTFVGKGEVNE